jgi:hypothetical protein
MGRGSLHQERVERLLAGGSQAFEEGDVGAAVTQWRELLRLDPGNSEAQHCLDEVESEIDRVLSGGIGEAEILDGESIEVSGLGVDGPAGLELPELEVELAELEGLEELGGQAQPHQGNRGRRGTTTPIRPYSLLDTTPSAPVVQIKDMGAPPTRSTRPPALDEADEAAFEEDDQALDTFFSELEGVSSMLDDEPVGPEPAEASSAPGLSGPRDLSPGEVLLNPTPLGIARDDLVEGADPPEAPAVADDLPPFGASTGRAATGVVPRKSGSVQRTEAYQRIDLLTGKPESPEDRRGGTDEFVVRVTGDASPNLSYAAAAFQAGELLQALQLVEAVLEATPGDSAALDFLDRMKPDLENVLIEQVGPLDAVPHISVAEDVLMWMNLNHRAGFVLSQVDGLVTFDDILDLSGMGRFDTVRILARLLDEGVISR